jgi:putative FmdB family regulatory protein
MPIFEFFCEGCRRYKESYLSRSTSPDPACESCGKPMSRLISSFSVIFTGALTARYNDPKCENPYQEGFWAHRVKSSSSGAPEATFIDTWEKRREYMKEEGLIGHEDIGPVDPSSDGKWSNTRTGRPGTWV